jgi:hypothetical protein
MTICSAKEPMKKVATCQRQDQSENSENVFLVVREDIIAILSPKGIYVYETFQFADSLGLDLKMSKTFDKKMNWNYFQISPDGDFLAAGGEKLIAQVYATETLDLVSSTDDLRLSLESGRTGILIILENFALILFRTIRSLVTQM